MRGIGISAAAVALAVAGPAMGQPAVSLNQPLVVEGSLGADDLREEEDRRPYDDVPIRLPDAGRFRVSLTSLDFDTVVQIRREGEEEVLAEDDDGGDEFNSLLSFSPGAGGTYVVRVLGFSEEAAGEYRLAVEALPPLPPATVARPNSVETMRWQVWEGTLDEADAELDGSRVDDYAITMRAGEEVLIRLDSDDFDPVLNVLSETGREGDPIASDDDGGGGLNSFLVFTPEETGRYIVRVRAYETGGGAYRLRVGR